MASPQDPKKKGLNRQERPRIKIIRDPRDSLDYWTRLVGPAPSPLLRKPPPPAYYSLSTSNSGTEEDQHKSLEKTARQAGMDSRRAKTLARDTLAQHHNARLGNSSSLQEIRIGAKEYIDRYVALGAKLVNGDHRDALLAAFNLRQAEIVVEILSAEPGGLKWLDDYFTRELKVREEQFFTPPPVGLVFEYARGAISSSQAELYFGPWGGSQVEKVFSRCNSDLKTQGFSPNGVLELRKSLGDFVQRAVGHESEALKCLSRAVDRRVPFPSEVIFEELQFFLRDAQRLDKLMHDGGIVSLPLIGLVVENLAGEEQRAIQPYEIISEIESYAGVIPSLAARTGLPPKVTGALWAEFPGLLRTFVDARHLNSERSVSPSESDFVSALNSFRDPMRFFEVTGATRQSGAMDSPKVQKILYQKASAQLMDYVVARYSDSVQLGSFSGATAQLIAGKDERFLAHVENELEEKWGSFPRLSEAEKEFFSTLPLKHLSKVQLVKSGLLRRLRRMFQYTTSAFTPIITGLKIVDEASCALTSEQEREDFFHVVASFNPGWDSRGRVRDTSSSSAQLKFLSVEAAITGEFLSQLGGDYKELREAALASGISATLGIQLAQASEPGFKLSTSSSEGFYKSVEDKRHSFWTKIRGKPINRDPSLLFEGRMSENFFRKLIEHGKATYQIETRNAVGARRAHSLHNHARVEEEAEQGGGNLWGTALNALPKILHVSAASPHRLPTKEELELIEEIAIDIHLAMELTSEDAFLIAQQVTKQQVLQSRFKITANAQGMPEKVVLSLLDRLSGCEDALQNASSMEESVRVASNLPSIRDSEQTFVREMRRALIASQSIGARASFYLGQAEGGSKAFERAGNMLDILSNASQIWKKRLSDFPNQKGVNRLMDGVFRLSTLEHLIRSCRMPSSEDLKSTGITFYLSQGFELEYAGYLANTCATGVRQVSRRAACLAFADEKASLKDPFFKGCSIVFQAKDIDGNPCLILRGFNPAGSSSSILDSGSLFERAVQYLEELRPLVPFQSILVPDENFAGGALSNRPEVVHHVFDTYGKGERRRIQNPDQCVYNNHKLDKPLLVIRSY